MRVVPASLDTYSPGGGLISALGTQIEKFLAYPFGSALKHLDMRHPDPREGCRGKQRQVCISEPNRRQGDGKQGFTAGALEPGSNS